METLNKVKGAKAYVKPVNYALGLGSIGAGVLYLLEILSGRGDTLYAYFAPFYFAAFGIIMISADLGLQAIVENCNFLDIYIGRGMFSVFVGCQIVNAATNNTLASDFFKFYGVLVGYVLMGLGFYLILLHCLEKETSMSGTGGNVANDLKMKAAKAVITTQLGI